MTHHSKRTYRAYVYFRGALVAEREGERAETVARIQKFKEAAAMRTVFKPNCLPRTIPLQKLKEYHV